MAPYHRVHEILKPMSVSQRAAVLLAAARLLRDCRGPRRVSWTEELISWRKQAKAVD